MSLLVTSSLSAKSTQRISAPRSRQNLTVLPARLAHLSPQSVGTTPPVRESLSEQLQHFQPIPVIGTDSALIEKYNDFLAAWRSELAARKSDPDADQSSGDECAWAVINAPANTPEGMLLKIKVVGSQAGTSCEAETEFLWITDDWQADQDADPGANPIETAALISLRADLRRLTEVSVPVSSLRVAHSGTSKAIADLTSALQKLDQTADETNEAADEAQALPNGELDSFANKALAAAALARDALTRIPGRSIADIFAKVEAIRSFAEAKNLATAMNKADGPTEKMLWSICQDLLAISRPIARTTDTQCLVSALSDQFRRTVDEIDFYDDFSDSPFKMPTQTPVDELTTRVDVLRDAAADNKALDLKGALFQIACLGGMLEEITSPGIAKPRRNELKKKMYRILHSSTSTVAGHCGAEPRDYAGDFFLNIEPSDYGA